MSMSTEEKPAPVIELVNSILVAAVSHESSTVRFKYSKDKT
jgi:hypothetical protein